MVDYYDSASWVYGVFGEGIRDFKRNGMCLRSKLGRKIVKYLEIRGENWERYQKRGVGGKGKKMKMVHRCPRQGQKIIPIALSNDAENIPHGILTYMGYLIKVGFQM